VQLAPGAMLSGLNRENQMGAAPSAAMTARPAVSAPVPATAPEAGGSSWFSRALGMITGLFGAGVAAQPAPAAAATAAPQSLQSLMAPAAPATSPQPVAAPATPRAAAIPATAPAAAPAPTAAPSAAATAQRPRDAAFFEEQELRLRTLKRLRDSGLITEQEYQQKRKEVLEQI